MQPQVLDYLQQTAQAVLANAYELSDAYMNLLLENATGFCSNFDIDEETVIKTLNHLITKPHNLG